MSNHFRLFICQRSKRGFHCKFITLKYDSELFFLQSLDCCVVSIVIPIAILIKFFLRCRFAIGLEHTNSILVCMRAFGFEHTSDLDTLPPSFVQILPEFSSIQLCIVWSWFLKLVWLFDLLLYHRRSPCDLAHFICHHFWSDTHFSHGLSWHNLCILSLWPNTFSINTWYVSELPQV